MPREYQNQTTDEIRLLMKNINQAWLDGRPQELEAYFHPDIQFAGPNLEIFGAGREICIKSYQDFLNQVDIQKFSESEYEIQTWEKTAIISYTFDIQYNMEGNPHRDKGKDLFVFTYEQGRWLAVRRIMFPM